MSRTYTERDVIIEALDQFITNSQDVCEEMPGLDSKVATATELLERLQLDKLRELGVQS